MRKDLWLRLSLAFIGVLMAIAANNIWSYAGEPDEVQKDGGDLRIPVKQIEFMFGINGDNSIYQTVTFVLSDGVKGKAGEKIEKYMQEKFEEAKVSGLMFDTDIVDGCMSYSYIRSNAALDACDELLTEIL